MKIQTYYMTESDDGVNLTTKTRTFDGDKKLIEYSEYEKSIKQRDFFIGWHQEICMDDENNCECCAMITDIEEDSHLTKTI